MTDPPDDWSDWLGKHGAALVLFARQWVGNRADAEDVVQEAFLRFWRSRDRARDPAAYLFTCVKSSASQWWRSRRRRTHGEQRVARGQCVAEESSFIGPVEEAERRAMLEAAMRTLPEVQREVLVLKIWGELSFPQIGVALGIPANTAASRYRYALDKLREVLAEQLR